MRDEETGIATFAITVVNQRREVVQSFRMRILGRRAAAVTAFSDGVPSEVGLDRSSVSQIATAGE